jgi:hypothetical protein
MRSYTEDHPLRGERMVIGMIRSISDIPVRRSDIRSSILRVDKGGLDIRRGAIGRRIVG